jgi:hypothetical protein
MDMGRRAQGTGIFLLGGPVGEPGRGLVYRGQVWKKALEMGTSLHTGPVGMLGGDPFTGNSEIVEGGLWKRSISLYGCCVRGTWRGGAPLLGILKVM